MPYLNITTDVSSSHVGDVRRRGTLPAALRGEILAAFYGVLDEIEQAAILVATSASIATTLACGDEPSIVAADLKAYLPAEPVIYPAVAAKLVQAGLDHGLILPLQAYDHRLSHAQRLSRAILAAGPAPSEQVRAEELDKLAFSWQNTCGTALAAKAALRAALIDAGATVDLPRNPITGELLRAAHLGGAPCITSGGAISIPGWAESRRAPRFAARLAARIFTGGGRYSVLIDNVSETGIRLSNIRGGERGAHVTIELPDAEPVTGTIVWSHGGRAGVKLDARLPANHPLISNPMN